MARHTEGWDIDAIRLIANYGFSAL
jgi:hypothetical protein